MIVPPHREGGQAQFIAQPVPKDTRDGRINCLIDYLQQHISEPHNLDSLADVVSMSRRTLTRHFIKATGMSVADWLTAERLRRSQILLEAGTDINARDKWGNTLLHYIAASSMRGSKEAAALVMDFGTPDVNAVNNEGLTALDIAAKKNDESLVKFLLKYS